MMQSLLGPPLPVCFALVRNKHAAILHSHSEAPSVYAPPSSPSQHPLSLTSSLSASIPRSSIPNEKLQLPNWLCTLENCSQNDVFGANV